MANLVSVGVIASEYERVSRLGVWWVLDPSYGEDKRRLLHCVCDFDSAAIFHDLTSFTVLKTDDELAPEKVGIHRHGAGELNSQPATRLINCGQLQSERDCVVRPNNLIGWCQRSDHNFSSFGDLHNEAGVCFIYDFSVLSPCSQGKARCLFHCVWVFDSFYFELDVEPINWASSCNASCWHCEFKTSCQNSGVHLHPVLLINFDLSRIDRAWHLKMVSWECNLYRTIRWHLI